MDIDAVGLGLCAWDTLLLFESFPEANRKLTVARSAFSGGGPVPTALAVFCRLGGKAAFIGAVGDRQEGLKIRCDLAHYGVDVSEMILRPERRSPCAYILIDQRNGDRTVVLDPGNVAPISVAELPENLLRDADYLLMDGREPDVFLYAAEICHSSGGKVIIDAGSPRARIEEMMAQTDHAVVSEDFAIGTFPQLSSTEALLKIAAMGPASVVITEGGKGGVWWEKGVTGRYEAFPVKAVDTTGAGDAFHGAYLYGLKQHWEMPQRCRFAAAVAAMVCRGIGGRVAAPRYDDVVHFMARADQQGGGK